MIHLALCGELELSQRPVAICTNLAFLDHKLRLFVFAWGNYCHEGTGIKCSSKEFV